MCAALLHADLRALRHNWKTPGPAASWMQPLYLIVAKKRERCGRARTQCARPESPSAAVLLIRSPRSELYVGVQAVAERDAALTALHTSMAAAAKEADVAAALRLEVDALTAAAASSKVVKSTARARARFSALKGCGSTFLLCAQCRFHQFARDLLLW